MAFVIVPVRDAKSLNQDRGGKDRLEAGDRHSINGSRKNGCWEVKVRGGPRYPYIRLSIETEQTGWVCGREI